MRDAARQRPSVHHAADRRPAQHAGVHRRDRAAVAIADASLYEATAALAEQMRQAMASRAVIEQAKGIVMAERGCSSDEAFEFLVQLSQTTHVKLREVAQRLVEQVAGEESRRHSPATEG